jgi:hypothetical protein
LVGILWIVTSRKCNLLLDSVSAVKFMFWVDSVEVALYVDRQTDKNNFRM